MLSPRLPVRMRGRATFAAPFQWLWLSRRCGPSYTSPERSLTTIHGSINPDVTRVKRPAFPIPPLALRIKILHPFFLPMTLLSFCRYLFCPHLNVGTHKDSLGPPGLSPRLLYLAPHFLPVERPVLTCLSLSTLHLPLDLFRGHQPVNLTPSFPHPHLSTLLLFPMKPWTAPSLTSSDYQLPPALDSA